MPEDEGLVAVAVAVPSFAVAVRLLAVAVQSAAAARQVVAVLNGQLLWDSTLDVKT